LGASEVRALAERAGVTPTKKLGQNFVHDANTVRKIVAAAALVEGDHVLEVGPGLGSLTLGLLDAGATVTAIEIDSRLAALLPQTIATHQPGGQCTVIEADAMEVKELPTTPTVLVANLPYNTAVPIVLHLLRTFPTLRRVLVMVQSEVAERLAAHPGSKAYGSPSVKAGWFGRWSVAAPVSRHVFWPIPNVDSLLVAMDATEPPGDEALRKIMDELVTHAFRTRRKMARGALAEYLGSDVVSEVIEKAGLQPTDRGEAWSVEDFVALARVVKAR
jgi:16S rRNA (adenine1518-N6/adenine1519-N6)-dimethyltransferase|tara:strand:+ start:1443 stop:2267 length:825 start_codon:yes stop_codon:yes gene_type:complete